MEIEVTNITESLNSYCMICFEDWHIYYQTSCEINYNGEVNYIESKTKTFLKTNLSIN